MVNRGIWYGVAAYCIWGFFPAYFKLLEHVPPAQVVSHRIVWSCLLMLGFILLARQWQEFRAGAFTARALQRYALAGVLIGTNWLVWVWAVYNGRVVESSLGYFITPLLNVVLGVVVLRERLRRWQWVSVALAATGVLYLTVAHGSLPWLALFLGFTFAIYALVKKTAPLGSLHGLTVETGVLAPVALLYLVYVSSIGQDAFLHTGALTNLLLIGSGLVTMVPLLLFATATRLAPLSGLGVLQYISPTLHFLTGVLLFREPFNQHQLIGFVIVWVALIIFAVEGLVSHRAQPVVAE